MVEVGMGDNPLAGKNSHFIPFFDFFLQNEQSGTQNKINLIKLIISSNRSSIVGLL